MRTRCLLRTFAVLALVLALATGARAVDGPRPSSGQTLYVPAYSHIYGGDKENPFLLTVTLSIRNVDPKRPITVMAVDYHGTRGGLVRRYAPEPVELAPLESLRFVVPESDATGGSGANFIVVWKAGRPTNPPIVEAIMIGTKNQQGISFCSRGQEIVDPGE